MCCLLIAIYNGGEVKQMVKEWVPSFELFWPRFVLMRFVFDLLIWGYFVILCWFLFGLHGEDWLKVKISEPALMVEAYFSRQRQAWAQPLITDMYMTTNSDDYTDPAFVRTWHGTAAANNNHSYISLDHLTIAAISGSFFKDGVYICLKKSPFSWKDS